MPELAIEWLLDTPEKNWQLIEGTLCFADISGFTALAERLAQRGRVGGEELVETLGRVFSEMLEIAHSRDGVLLKFGGDALLLFFRGQDHATDAACAALEMRRALRSAANIPTAVGPLRLSMSIGLHSDECLFFLVGSSHRELLLLGPAANGVVAIENAAGPGDILMSPSTAALLPATAVKTRADGGLLLRWRTARVPAQGRRPGRVGRDAAARRLFPGISGEFLASAVPDPEHRTTCLAFIRFSGTDALLAREGPAALADALEKTIGAAQDAIATEDLTLLVADIDRDGGKLFVAAGLPHAQEDAAGALLRALRRLMDADLPLGLQAGVNRGHAFVAEVGAPGRAAYTAMGDTTNTAARITGKAPVGTILAHPSVLEDSRTVFETRQAEPLILKGKKAPLTVYEVGRQTGARRREGLQVTAFMGRETELAALAAVAAGTAGRENALVCLVGDPGLGKSRLLEEALATANVRPQLALRAEPYDVNSPYRVLRDPLRALLDITPGDPAQMREALAAAVARTAPDLMPVLALLGDVTSIEIPDSPEVKAIQTSTRPAFTATALGQLLRALRSGPGVIVVDDAHWCDDASARVLQHLASEDEGLFWLVARRETQTGFRPESGRELHLEPLPFEHIRSLLVMASEAAPLRPHDLETIVQRASGNPLFAMEILRAARDVGSIDAVPESLEATMATQVDALDPSARRLLRYASVLGRRFDRTVLLEVVRSAAEELDFVALQRLTQFLEPDGDAHLRFRSGVLRDATYEALAYRLRSRLHRTVAEVMERLAEDPAAVADSLALHYARAQEYPRAWQHARLAGDRARQAYANADASRFYELAIEAARRVPAAGREAVVEVWTRLGDVRERAGLLEDSLEAFSNALRLVGDDRLARAELLCVRASAKERIRAFPAALRDLSSGLRLIADIDSEKARAIRARIKKSIAWIRYGQDRPSQALEQAVDAAAEARAAGEQAALGGALVVEELARLMLEGPGDGRHLKEALAIFEALGDLRMQALVRANLGLVCAVAGRWDEGVSWLTAARDQFLHIGDTIRSADPALNLGEMLVKQRRFDDAEPVLREAIRTLRAAHFTEGVNRAEIQLAQILLERGDIVAAGDMLQRVQREFSEAGQALAALEVVAVLAKVRLRQGEAKEALALIEQATKAAGSDARLLLPVVACVRGQILAALGRLAEAEGVLSAGIQAANEQGLPYEQALLLLARADLSTQCGGGPETADVTKANAILAGLGVLGYGSASGANALTPAPDPGSSSAVHEWPSSPPAGSRSR